jgi:hypothetical protein
VNSVNIYNITTARMSDEDGNTEEDKPEILAIEKSPASAGVEQKKKKLKKGGLIEDMGAHQQATS